MDILTGLSVVVISIVYLFFIIVGPLKAKRRGQRSAVIAPPQKRQRRDGFMIEDDYPPKVSN